MVTLSTQPEADNAPPAYGPADAANNPHAAVTLSTSINADSSDHLLVTVTPPKFPVNPGTEKAGKRAPVDICCVIDVSGSMQVEAPVPSETDTTEHTGLSVLDVVKHAVRTIVATLQDEDRIAIVTFSQDATTRCDFTAMTEEGKKEVTKIVEALDVEGATNLWAGLKTGMSLFADRGKAPSKSSSWKFGSSSSSSKPPSSSGPKSPSVLSSFSKHFKRTSVTSKEPAHEESKPEPAKETDKKEVPAEDSPVFDSKRVSSLLLLTDGLPNVEPPRGHIPMLKTYLDSCPDKNFSISTFGFGYSLDSALLNEIAEIGHGSFGFIPDAGMVGTVFVHAVANLYSIFGGCTIDVEVEGDDKVDAVLGGIGAVKNSWGVKVEVGDLQYGQTKDVVVRLKEKWTGTPNIHVTATYRPWTLEQSAIPHKTSITVPSALNDPPNPDVTYHSKRLEFVSATKQFLASKSTTFPSGDTVYVPIAKSIRELIPEHKDAIALAEDIEGQAVLAISTSEYFERWGKHYLYSLSCAHRRQQCGNFKDPGLQVYGKDSTVFTKARDELDAAFDSLPPPKPSIAESPPWRSFGGYGGAPGAAPQARYIAPQSMSIYNSSAAPCFTGDCQVTLGDGSLIRLDQVRRGAHISNGNTTSIVAAILRTTIPADETGVEICHIGDLQVTPWHPIFLPEHGGWVFPASIANPIRRFDVDAVYSILLQADEDSEKHSIMIGGVRCVALGHGVVADGDVRTHAFFGNWEMVLQAMRLLPGFMDVGGVVECGGVARCETFGVVNGFLPSWAKKVELHKSDSERRNRVPSEVY